MNARINRRRQGFSLLESLVSLLVLSIGMLGVAGLYTQSLQAGRTAMLRHHAVNLAGDVAAQIRANGGANNPCGADGCGSAETLPGGKVAVQHGIENGLAVYTITVSWEEPDAQPEYTLTIAVNAF